MFSKITHQLRVHAPFTALGALTGIALMLVFIEADIPRTTSETLFWVLHPMHVVFSALVTTAMYRLHGKGGFLATILIGYLGSVGIATLSDSIIPWVGELLLELPNEEAHLGFIEKWWLINPLALAGIGLAYVYPRTRFPHAGHVLLSTWASLFHMTMALGAQVSASTVALIGVFLFLAVWVPCCTSDIIFPLLFAKGAPKDACVLHGSPPPQGEE